ncbi:hypothetical protein Tco_0959927 [Tanacetum coccineum]
MYHSVASTNGKMACMLHVYFIEIIVRLRKGRRSWLRIIDLFLRRLSLATTTMCKEFSGVPDQSPEGFVTALIAKTSPKALTQLPRMGAREVSLSGGGSKIMGCSGRVKDYVLECIRSEIKQRPKSEWIMAGASSSVVLGLWMSLDEDRKIKRSGDCFIAFGCCTLILSLLDGDTLHITHHSIQDLDKEQVLVCIIVALLCLQKNPALQPSMKEIVEILSGDLELPPLRERAKAIEARMVEAHGGVPAATSRLSPLPPERAGYDRGATINIPLDTAHDFRTK